MEGTIMARQRSINYSTFDYKALGSTIDPSGTVNGAWEVSFELAGWGVPGRGGRALTNADAIKATPSPEFLPRFLLGCGVVDENPRHREAYLGEYPSEEAILL